MEKIKLDTNVVPPVIEDFNNKLKSSIIGQNQALDKISNSLCKLYSGIRNEESPVLSFLFLGSTGVGKTETVKILSDYFFGNRISFTRINCQEYSQDHTVSRLIGSPPGYIGGEIEPILSQNNIDKHWKEAKRRRRAVFRNYSHKIHKCFNITKGEFLSIILFDEVEKAHPRFWDILLGALDDGHIIMSNNKEVNLRNSIIVMTSNVGSYEMNKKLSNSGIGFNISDNERQNEIEELVIESAKNEFPPEFINRFDSVIVFNSLKREDVIKMFDKEFSLVKERIKKKTRATIEVTDSAREYIIDKGYSRELGARNMNRYVNDLIVSPISKLIVSDEIKRNDIIEIDFVGNELAFYKQEKKTTKTKTPKRIKAKAASK